MDDFRRWQTFREGAVLLIGFGTLLMCGTAAAWILVAFFGETGTSWPLLTFVALGFGLRIAGGKLQRRAAKLKERMDSDGR